MSGISSIPTTYAGVRFRSTLEADWAATLDSLGIIWQYEPEAVRLPSGMTYRPDFYLPRIATWLEIKGPHMERVFKAYELARSVADPVVIGMAPERGCVTWQLVGAGSEAALVECRNCGAWWWVAVTDGYGCRAHRRGGWGEDDLSPVSFDGVSDLPFVRAPRAAT